MRQMSPDLLDLLSPHEPEKFFSDFWEQRYLHVKRSRARRYLDAVTSYDVAPALHRFVHPSGCDRRTMGRLGVSGRARIQSRRT